MLDPSNGHYNDAIGAYEHWTTLSYDDITHAGFVHDAYFLRFFEHAREFMIDAQYLQRLHEKESCGFVAVKTEQTHANNQKSLALTKVGSFCSVRTKVEIDGEYRIKFVHEVFLYDTMPKGSNNDLGVLLCRGYVDMIVFNFASNRISKLPGSIREEVHFKESKVKPVRKEKLELTDIKDSSYTWTVQDFDTDFTKVVYQAKYLQYYEVCRKKLYPDHKIFKVEINFKEPAVFGDEILVSNENFRYEGKFKIILTQSMKNSKGRVINQSVSELVRFDSDLKLVKL